MLIAATQIDNIFILAHVIVFTNDISIGAVRTEAFRVHPPNTERGVINNERWAQPWVSETCLKGIIQIYERMVYEHIGVRSA